MFLRNLKRIIANLPLTLSDSYDPKDVSLNRIITLIVVIFVFGSPYVILRFYPEMLEPFLPYWQGATTYLAAQTAGNLIKKKYMSGGNGNA